MRHCVDFYPSGADVSLILQVILIQSLPQIFWHFDVCYVPFFLKSLPAQAILWFYDSSPSFSGSWWTRMMIAHSPKLLIPQPQGTSATMHILGEGAGGVFCHTTTACCPFGGNERRRTREVPAEHLMTQPVLEWKPCWEGGWWIGCEVVWSWVMKWLFKTGEPDGPAKNWHCN